MAATGRKMLPKLQAYYGYNEIELNENNNIFGKLI